MTETLTPSQVAKRWQTSDSAVRRALKADKLEGAAKDAEGVWRIPLAAVLAHFGPEPAPTSDTPPKAAADDESAAVRIAELEALVKAQAENLADLRRALKHLEGLPETVAGLSAYLMGQSRPAAIPMETSEPRRRWWQRRSETP